LVMIRPLGRGLAMEQLRYANEVRSIDEVPIPKVDVKKAELDMAVQLVEQAATEKFEPQKYEDTVKARIQEQIQRKVDGEETTEEVARLLGLSPAQIRSYTRAGFLSPARDARGNLGFTFQDLVLLKAAKGLLAARIPAAKIRGSLRRLKQQLPRGRALSELRITAEGHR